MNEYKIAWIFVVISFIELGFAFYYLQNHSMTFGFTCVFALIMILTWTIEWFMKNS